MPTELSGLVRIPEKQVADHLTHVALSFAKTAPTRSPAIHALVTSALRQESGGGGSVRSGCHERSRHGSSVGQRLASAARAKATNAVESLEKVRSRQCTTSPG